MPFPDDVSPLLEAPHGIVWSRQTADILSYEAGASCELHTEVIERA